VLDIRLAQGATRQFIGGHEKVRRSRASTPAVQAFRQSYSRDSQAQPRTFRSDGMSQLRKKTVLIMRISLAPDYLGRNSKKNARFCTPPSEAAILHPTSFDLRHSAQSCHFASSNGLSEAVANPIGHCSA
jgi:hypothetical protein